MTPLPTLRQLQFFVALARRKSFSRAAEDMLVSQSTLSAAIKELEHGLDVMLVDRSTRSFALTMAGQTMVERAEEILGLTESMARTASKSAPLSEAVQFGVIPTIGPYILPALIPALEKQYPDLSLYIREDLTADLLDRLRSGRLDLVLLAFPYETQGMETLMLGADPFVYACRKTAPLARQKAVTLEDLDTENLLLLEDGHCLRDQALSACQLQSAETAKSFGGTSLFTLAQMVRSGLGATLLPQMAVKQGLATSADLLTIPFDGKSGMPSREIGLAWRRGSGLREEAEAMAKVIQGIL